MTTKRDLTYDKLLTYFRELAINNVYIDNFIGFSEDELALKGSTKKGLKGYTLALFQYVGNLSGNKQRTIGHRNVGFAIVKPVMQPQNYKEQYKVIAEAERIGLTVIARLEHDNKQPEHWLYNNFNKDSVRFNELKASEADNFYGMEFYFKLNSWEPLTIDPADWEDIKSVCDE